MNNQNKTTTNMHNLRTRDDFITFFEAIPDEQWCVGTFHTPNKTAHCVIGHIERVKAEATATVRRLEKLIVNPVSVNDNATALGATPKTRILTALRMDRAALQAIIFRLP
jgi:hypothetical protein